MDELWKMEIAAPADARDALTVYLFQRVAYGWEEEERAGGSVLFRVHVEESRVGEEIAAEIAARWPAVAVSTVAVPNSNWMLAWREFFTPVPIGETFVVLAPWMVEDNPYPERTAIVIDPKTAFGTGHHPTTALCLGLVARLYESGRLRPGMRFLDLGTGTGILGLGCALLGLAGVGLDIDPLAVDNAVENKAFNAVGERFEVREGGVDAALEMAGEAGFDVVLANILAGPLIEMAPSIARLVRPGGCLALSGILSEQAASVAAAYVAQGLAEPAVATSAEWSGLVWEER
ncbi:MAG: 50S ribosomal protein L11 methyltransferase [Desulfovibrionaceae bacterium]|jgi:ribosomal protein L11 methyltransferase|nr:50S ribosomal protein L11 methyltransferase [Desulfovibrionaceae bacterium]